MIPPRRRILARDQLARCAARDRGSRGGLGNLRIAVLAVTMDLYLETVGHELFADSYFVQHIHNPGDIELSEVLAFLTVEMAMRDFCDPIVTRYSIADVDLLGQPDAADQF